MNASTPTTSSGYSRFSIFVHWISAILIVSLFLTHEGERGSAAFIFHVSGGAIAGAFLLWRVWHRIRRGMTTKPEQSFLLNLASQIVIWGFLAAIVLVILTGYLLPWSRGSAIDIFGMVSIPSPMARNHDLHEWFEKIHTISGQVFVPLLILHVLGAIKHAVIDKDGITRRMFKPVEGGK